MFCAVALAVPAWQAILADLDSQKPVGELAAQAGAALIGTPYKAKTLEVSDTHETCVIRFDGLDCVTFVESSLALARMSRSGETSAASLKDRITQMRYRGGEINGYLSRLHYTSDWAHDNIQRGLFADVTPTLPGAKPWDVELGFMSRNPSSYRQLKANPSWVPKLAAMEKEWSARTFSYLPKEKIPAAAHLLKPGDVIGFVTTRKGLDTSHVAIVSTPRRGDASFLHASTGAMKVVKDTSLAGYTRRQRSCPGVLILRPL